MPDDLFFDFWDEMRAAPADAKWHPRDRTVFNQAPHSFDRECLPGGFIGSLKTALVVLLFLSPGLAIPEDHDDARSEAGQRRYAAQRTGGQPLPAPSEHPPFWRWFSRVTRCFTGSEDAKRERIAILNIAPYHSVGFHDWPMLTALPSARASVDFAQRVLFPEARSGGRVVVCLRAAPHWGLDRGAEGRADGSLFAPLTTRGGSMIHLPVRQQAIAAVNQALSLPVL